MSTRKKSIIAFVILALMDLVLTETVAVWGIQWHFLFFPTAITLGRMAIDNGFFEGKSPVGWLMTVADAAGSLLIAYGLQFIKSDAIHVFDAAAIVVGLVPRWVILRLVFRDELRRRRDEMSAERPPAAEGGQK